MAALRVLLVDDMPDLRLLVRTVLERTHQFQVVAEAGDGSEAIEQAERCQPDLALLDVTMPVMGGVDALPRIREVAPACKVVILSNMNRAAAADHVGSGAVAYLEKGLSPTRLVAELLLVFGLLETIEQAVDETRARLAGDPASAGSARQFVAETLERWESASDLDTVSLLVSEVVTNAIRHAPGDLEVAVRLRTQAIRVEVTDSSTTAPLPRHAADDDESGRGMVLIEALATVWGVTERDDGGKTVWFEVPRFDESPIG